MTARPLHAPPSAAVAVPRATKLSGVTTPRRQERAHSSDHSIDHQQQPQQYGAPATAMSHQPDQEEEFSASADHDDDDQQFAHWRAHSEHHFAVRKAMIARLQQLHPLLATDATMQYAGQFTRIPELVQRLELMLYKAAASLDEYTNLCTLERRVHSLVTLLEPLPTPAPSALRKRPVAPASAAAVSLSSCKRRRRSVSWSVASSSSVATVSGIVAMVAPSKPHCLTSELSADLLAHVFGFVDGVDTLRRVALVNRFFRREAPRLVQTLRLDVGDAAHAHALRGRVKEIVAPCVNLTTLVVTNSRNVGKKNGFMRASASSCHGRDGHPEETVADELVPPPTVAPSDLSSRYTGRELLHELSALWLGSPRRVVFPKLRKLALRAPFDCANEADATLACLHALASNLSGSHKAPPPAFESLVLDTTLLGDRRVARLVALLARARPHVFAHHLRALELRNNFVGEAGMAALCRSLAGHAWRQLEVLALPRNIITDGDASALARSVDALPQLSQLDVRENFIGKPGFEALARRLRRCGPDEQRVAVVTAHNCMESSEAVHLFM